MKRTIHIVMVVLMTLLGAAVAQSQERPRSADPAPSERSAARFVPVEIWIDSHDQPLAAYQLEFKPTAGDVKIVGIEGGEAAPYAEPPYYDPHAMMSERVIIAAFSTGAAATLPTGRFRIATIHVRVAGSVEPTYAATLSIAATAGGKTIPADVTLKTGSQP
jgi:hypothetical protein